MYSDDTKEGADKVRWYTFKGGGRFLYTKCLLKVYGLLPKQYMYMYWQKTEYNLRLRT